MNNSCISIFKTLKESQNLGFLLFQDGSPKGAVPRCEPSISGEMQSWTGETAAAIGEAATLRHDNVGSGNENSLKRIVLIRYKMKGSYQNFVKASYLAGESKFMSLWQHPAGFQKAYLLVPQGFDNAGIPNQTG